MTRKNVRCLNPNGCNFSMEWRAGVIPPKACPLCGFDKSHEEADRIKAKYALFRDNKRESRHQELVRAAIQALPWWGRWLVGLGIRKVPVVRRHSWTARVGIPFTFCADCGVVERRDFSNLPCEGKVRLVPRKQAGTDAADAIGLALMAEKKP